MSSPNQSTIENKKLMVIPSAPLAANPMLAAVVFGGNIPAYGINKLINPKKDSKFSPNLYKFLTYGKNKVFTNVFQDAETGKLYFGLREDNGIWIGTKAMAVFCQGTKAESFSYATSITQKWNDVTKWFWSKYLEVGKKIYDLPEWQNMSTP
jgi:hypothetical protein